MREIRIPVLRRGQLYQSLDVQEVRDQRNGAVLASTMQANSGLIRRDLRKIQESFEVLQSVPIHELLSISRKAGELFMYEALPIDEAGNTLTPQEYVEFLSATSGLPHNLCRRNMSKIYEVFTEMPTILGGLTRGLDPEVLDTGYGEQSGSPVSFYPAAKSLGVVLPSNSPGVNSIWMPAVALKIPVVLKPGREEPWTPYRIIQAFIAAGCPPEAFCFYPTSHEGSSTIMSACDRSIIFGDEHTIAQYAGNPAVQAHGPGWSKILIGTDQVEHWQDYLDLIAASVVQNGGRSCINASAVVTPAHGREIADALARRLAEIHPEPPDSEEAVLSAFANSAFADSIDHMIEEGLRTPGAVDLTAQYRNAPRRVEFQGSTYLLPTVIWCESFSHPLANREFLFPYTSVVELPQEEMIETIGSSLVVTAITEDPVFTRQILQASNIQRLNIGAIPTSQVRWDQPHEGNLFEFLYQRRAIQIARSTVTA
ncbi:MAG: aldehyde dehydrogenase family protein [bacterium]|jgi:hypothetical protein